MHRRNASLASDYQLTRSESREKVTVIAGLAAAIALSFASSVIAFQSAVSKFLRLWLSFTERFPAAGISLHALSGLFFVLLSVLSVHLPSAASATQPSRPSRRLVMVSRRPCSLSFCQAQRAV